MDQRHSLDHGAAPVGTIIDGLFDRLRAPGSRSTIVDRRGHRVEAIEFADTVEHAATGLVRRGLRPDDVVGVLAPVGIERLTAIYTAMAAGGIALPLEIASGLETLLDVLIETDARLILVSSALAVVALELAERSRVRQVVAFGSAPATTPFADLVKHPRGRAGAEGGKPERRPCDNGVLTYHSSHRPSPRPSSVYAHGSTVSTTLHGHIDLVERMHQLDSALKLDRSDVVLAEPAISEPEQTVLVAAALWRDATVVTVDTGDHEELRKVLAGREVTVRGVPRSARIGGHGRKPG